MSDIRRMGNSGASVIAEPSSAARSKAPRFGRDENDSLQRQAPPAAVMPNPVNHVYYYAQRDMVYNATGQKLDLFWPKPAVLKDAPVLVMVHGGAWEMGTRKDMESMAQAFLRKGFVVASISYHLLPAPYPAAVDDISDAVKWVQQKLPQAAHKPVIVGHSAGAHLVLLTGLKRPGLVDKVIAIAPPTDLTQTYNATSPRRVQQFRGPYSVNEVSPLQQLRPDAPYMMVIHGDNDQTVPHAQSVAFKREADRRGATVDFISVPGRDHDLLLFPKLEPGPQQDLYRQMAEFITSP